MPNNIYTSEKVMPYVYYGIHNETGQFYFGSRFGKKSYLDKNLPSHIDFLSYQTSSEYVKHLGFHNFSWTILAEFFNSEDARQFEEFCISQYWRHPLSLNFNNGNKNFYVSPEVALKMRKPKSETTKVKMSISSTGEGNGFYGKTHSEQTKCLISSKNSGNQNGFYGKSHSKETKQLISQKNSGRIHSEETKIKMRGPRPNSRHPTGPAPIIECPHCKKAGGNNIMYQYHFDNCKLSPKFIDKTIECPHCKKRGAPNNMKRYHFDNCKM